MPVYPGALPVSPFSARWKLILTDGKLGFKNRLRAFWTSERQHPVLLIA
jgi:hypothetical protein